MEILTSAGGQVTRLGTLCKPSEGVIGLKVRCSPTLGAGVFQWMACKMWGTLQEGYGDVREAAAELMVIG
jgi:hypothetical protein